MRGRWEKRQNGRVQIVAVPAPGAHAVATFAVGHGADPRLLLWDRGLHLVRYLSITRTDDDDLTVTVQVTRAADGEPVPPTRNRGRDHGLGRLSAPPMVKQRVASYAMVISERGLLATRFSRRTSAVGTWGLPGGGREPGENPFQTVLREVYEETGQDVALDRLLDVQSDHWIGRAPNGVVEDFHALRIVYSARCEEPTEPVVHDVGGTTAEAQWVPLRRWRQVPWSQATRALLVAHLPGVIDELA